MRVQVDLKNITEKFLDSPNIAFCGYLCVEGQWPVTCVLGLCLSLMVVISTGECTGVVVHTGSDTLLANLIAMQHWPVD
jgi:hypothetical protein